MHPQAEIIPPGHAPGTPPHRERMEASIIFPLYGEVSVLPHCFERCSGSASSWPSHASSSSSMTAEPDRVPGDAVVVLDADIKDSPERIQGRVAAWYEGAEAGLTRRRTDAVEFHLLGRKAA